MYYYSIIKEKQLYQLFGPAIDTGGKYWKTYRTVTDSAGSVCRSWHVCKTPKIAFVITWKNLSRAGQQVLTTAYLFIYFTLFLVTA